MAEDTKYATLSWTPADVQSMTIGCDPDPEKDAEPTMPLEDAEEWLAKNAKHIQDRLCELGWQVIEELLAYDRVGTETS